MRRWGQAACRDRSGAAAIEFAIAMIPLTVLVFGAITYGGVIASAMALKHAAGEGVRAGVAGLSVCERQERAEAVARHALIFSPLVDAAVIVASVTPDRIRLDISFNYAVAPLTPVLFPVPATLSASVVTFTDGPELPGASC